MKLEGNGGTDTFSALVGDQSGGNVTITQSLVTSGSLLGSTVFPPEDKVTTPPTSASRASSRMRRTTRPSSPPRSPIARSPPPVAAARRPRSPASSPSPTRRHLLPRRQLGRRHENADLHLPRRHVRLGETLAKVTHRYKHAGKYHIQLTWRDQTGLSNDDNSLVVKVLPRHDFHHHHKKKDRDRD
jgi:hypothetical protein